MLKKLCCMSLRTGSIMIGWLSLVFSLVGIMAFCGLLIYTSVVANKVVDLKAVSVEDFASYDQTYSKKIIAFSIYFGYCILELVASTMLVLGSMENRHFLLLPWLFNMVFCLVAMCASSLSEIFFIFAAPSTAMSSAATFVIKVFAMCLAYLFFMTVLALYREIRSANKQRELPAATSAIQRHIPELHTPNAPEMPLYESSLYPNFNRFQIRE